MTVFLNTLWRFAHPFLARVDAERAHRLTLRSLRAASRLERVPVSPLVWKPGVRLSQAEKARLATRVFGLPFPTPVGLAAGFDKNGEVVDAMLGMGFGFVEVGTVTPRAQKGNQKPRVSRLPAQGAVINALGFNNNGSVSWASRLRTYRTCKAKAHTDAIIGVNIGPNATGTDRVGDYLKGFRTFAKLASYITLNISSPNTTGLRRLQEEDMARALLDRLAPLRAETPIPVLVKIAPDVSDKTLEALANLAVDKNISGMIATNTTTARDGLPKGDYPRGGLSGRPLRARATQVISRLYQHTQGQIPIIGVGGIESGQDAYDKIRAGASLVQLYTALIYHGPALIGRITKELAALLKRDGFANIRDAVGAKHVGAKHVGAKHVGSEHVGSEHVGSEHVGSENRGG